MGYATSVVIPPRESEQHDDKYQQGLDYTMKIPYECMAHVFHYPKPTDRQPFPLVCKRWHLVEGQSRHRVSLDTREDIVPTINSLFRHFNYVSRLTL